MAQISQPLSRFLVAAEGRVTHAERIYFDLIGLLSGLINLSATLDRSAAEETLPSLILSCEVALESFQELLTYPKDSATSETGLELSNLHGLAMTRDAAQATRLTCQWILSQNEQEKERDRSGQSGLPKDVVAQFKHLQVVADDLTKFGKTWISALQTSVGKIEFGSELRAQVLGDDLRALETGSMADLVQSWKATLKGWQDVRWE